MWVFPLAAFLIALAFAATLIRRTFRSAQLSLVVWAFALLAYAGASFSMFLGVLSGWTPAEFRVYWLLGAVLTVPLLAQGELYLLLPQRVADVCMLILMFGTAFAFSRIRAAPMHLAALHGDLPLGKDVFGAGTAAHRLPQLYSIPAYVLLVGGALWSAWRLRLPRSPGARPRGQRGRIVGTLAIAGGATIVAVGSGIGAGFGVVPLFSAALATGIAVMFWGFLRASSPPLARTD